MVTGRVAFLGVLLGVVAAGRGDEGRCVVAPVSPAPGVQAAEGEVFYQAVVTALKDHGGVEIVERAQSKQVLDEIDLAAALGDARAGAALAGTASKLSAETLLVPGICKIEQDFILSLRKLSLTSGVTAACIVRQTRLTSRFPACAKAMVADVLGSAGTPAAVEEPGVSRLEVEALRQRALQAGADKLFPALWERAEALRGKPDAAPADLAGYYLALLENAVRAASPPEGMVFVPGGEVTVTTSAGPRKLWVQPFFIDRCEVSVERYAAFLAAVESEPGGREKLPRLLPLTRNRAEFNAPSLPVTGVSCAAAEACAARFAQRLPTLLEWVRAAGYDAKRRYPCGGAAELPTCNLKGQADGFAVLAPAGVPGRDVSGFGVLGMTGNVREWTGTWHDKEMYARTPADAPREPSDGTMRMVLGGSWRTGPDRAEISGGEAIKPNEAFDDVGFRCAAPFFRRATDK